METRKFEIAAKIGRSMMFFAEHFGNLCLKLESPVTEEKDHERLKKLSVDLGRPIFGFGNFDVSIKKISFDNEAEAKEFAEKWREKGIFDEIGILEVFGALDDKNHFESNGND